MSDKKSTISITYKFKGDNSGLRDLASQVERIQQAFRDGVAPAEQLQTSLINFNQIAQSFQAIGDSVSQLNGMIQDAASAYAVQIEAERKLETVMRQRMAATDEQIQGIKDFCSAQQQIGVVGDEVQLAGVQQLATFLSTTGAITELIPAMNNLVVQQKGLNATQGDTVAIANLMGKAMQGQTSALRRVGITFTEAQEAALKNGTEMERAAMLAEIITQNVGDMNAAIAQTEAGKAQQLANALGDVKEQVGGVVAGIAPYVSMSAALVTTAANAGRAASAMRGLYTATLGANGMFRGLTASSVGSALGMNTAGVAARFLATGLRLVMSATVVGLAIAAITAAVTYFTDAADDAADATDSMRDAMERMKQAETAAAESMKDVRAQLELDIAATKDFNGTKAQEKKLVDELNQRYGATMGYFSSVASWYQALVSNSKAYCDQMLTEARTRMYANQIAELERANDDILYNADGSRKRYSTQRDKRWVTKTSTYGHRWSEEEEVVGSSDAEQAQAKYEANLQQQKTLRQRMESKASTSTPMPLTGSTTPPTGSAATASTGGRGSRSAGAAERQLNVLEQIEAQIRANEEAALTADGAEYEALRASTLELKAQADTLRAKQASLTAAPAYEPPAMAEIKTYEDLDKALSYYSDALRKAQPEERDEINKTIKTLEGMRDAWDKALNPEPPQKSDLDTYIDGVVSSAKAKFKSMGSPLEGMDLEQLKSGYVEIQNILAGMDGDITAEQRESLRKAAAEYAAYAKKASSSWSVVRTGWGNAKSVIGGIDGIRQAAEGSGNAWEKLSGIVDGALQIFDGMQAVVEMYRNFTAVTKMATTAQEAQTVAQTTGAAAAVSASAAKASAANAEATANVAAGAAGFFKAHSGIPFVGLALAAAGVAAMIAMMASLPKFAEGGIAYGPTLGLFGEYAGAANNPEVVAPLDRLQSLIGDNGAVGGELTCRVKGEDLEFVLTRRARRKSRT